MSKERRDVRSDMQVTALESRVFYQERVPGASVQRVVNDGRRVLIRRAYNFKKWNIMRMKHGIRVF